MIAVRGGGDLATGTIYRLHQCGYEALILETDRPAAIRRKAAFSEAVYDGTATVEGVTCRRVYTPQQCQAVWRRREIPLAVDPEASWIWKMRPQAVVDAILAKRNLGTSRDMAPLTIALGPGFAAGKDVDYVVETMRGHRLGRIIREGCAAPNTGVPGDIAGYGKERVIHAPAAGALRARAQIGDLVQAGQVLATIDGAEVTAALDGVLRGLIRDGYPVEKGLKIADIDPRKDQRENCGTISDKARCIAGSVLEILVCHDVERGMGYGRHFACSG